MMLWPYVLQKGIRASPTCVQPCQLRIRLRRGDLGGASWCWMPQQAGGVAGDQFPIAPLQRCQKTMLQPRLPLTASFRDAGTGS